MDSEAEPLVILGFHLFLVLLSQFSNYHPKSSPLPSSLWLQPFYVRKHELLEFKLLCFLTSAVTFRTLTGGYRCREVCRCGGRKLRMFLPNSFYFLFELGDRV